MGSTLRQVLTVSFLAASECFCVVGDDAAALSLIQTRADGFPALSNLLKKALRWRSPKKVEELHYDVNKTYASNSDVASVLRAANRMLDEDRPKYGTNKTDASNNDVVNILQAAARMVGEDLVGEEDAEDFEAKVNGDASEDFEDAVSPRSETIGETAELSEEGYRQVARMIDDNEMYKFARRVADTEDLVKLGDDSALNSTVPFHSGVRGTKTFLELKAYLKSVEGYAPGEQVRKKLSQIEGAQTIEYFQQEALAKNPVKFFLYDPAVYEPRFAGVLSNCERKGGDYMFVASLLHHKDRVLAPAEAEAFIVPCLFESYRRCTTTNHAEKPPPEPLGTTKPKRGRRKKHRQRKPPEPHPEDFESVPWMQAFDEDTDRCLKKVMETKTYKAKNGLDHVWVVADWAVNFGSTSRTQLLQNMTIGRMEVVDEFAASTSNRPAAVNQSRCSFVVPYASDLAYVEKWDENPSFESWMQRKQTVTFRFEDRQYVLFCGQQPCLGSPDATPLRQKSVEFIRYFGKQSLIEMERAPIQQFSDEMHDAKFCLVLRGDTPSSHSFYDSLAAHCVPILISDRWQAVAGPFASGRHGKLRGGLRSNTCSLQFSEQQWMYDMGSVADEISAMWDDQHSAREIFDNMVKYRKAFLWSMPGNIVSDLALQSARTCLKDQG